MRTLIFAATRIGVTLGLVLVVWMHSHWSVAVAITGLSVASEINFWLMMLIIGVKRP